MARLLLIDDDDTTREVLGVLLHAEGWEIADATCGEAAISLAASFSPDVVLSDLQMPGLSGAELARAMRSACGDDAVLLAMTATRLPATPDGYDAVLVKPFEASAVRDALDGAQRSTPKTAADLSVISGATFDRMKNVMPLEQLRALYTFAVNDAEGRVRTMENTSDSQTLRNEAHALRGSCGMIGADRLGALCASLEANGISECSSKADTLLEFRGELSALQRMLEKLLPSDI